MEHVSVFPRKRSPFWYVAYIDAKTFKRNPGRATPFRRDDPQGKRKALNYAHKLALEASANQAASAFEFWGAWVPGFIDRHYRNNAGTKARALNAWSQWRVFLANNQIVVPRALTHRHCIQFVDWRSAQKRWCGKQISWNTALTDLRIMSAIMQEALRMGIIEANPCARPGLKRTPAKLKPEITKEEEAAIRAHLPVWIAENEQERGWMLNCFEAGIRHGCRLRETQFDPCVDVSPDMTSITFRIKGGRDHCTQLHHVLRPLVAEMRSKGVRKFCTVPFMASKLWRAFFDSLGYHHLCFHCTRVTVVTRLARAGVSEQQAMAYVGHSSRLVHQIYQRVKPSDVDAAVAALN